MNDEKELHQGENRVDKTLFLPNSNTYGRELEFDDAYTEDPRWRVPKYFRSLSYEERGNIMYLVHAILGNIVVDNGEIHNIYQEASSVFLEENARRYLEEQLVIIKRILH